MKKKFIGLIPVRLKSTRLKKKPLLNLFGLPMFVHVYKRAKFSKLLSDVIVCCDSLEILNIAKEYNVKCIITKKKHKNGTERIAEAYNKLDKVYDYVVDIQGDEPLLNPQHIDEVIRYHLENENADIILPTIKSSYLNKTSIIKIVKNLDNKVLYLSRSDIPYEFSKKKKLLLKHLSIISFKPTALIKYSNTKRGELEKRENIELLRALETGLDIKSFNLKGDSFSIDIKSDYEIALKKLRKDKLLKKYL